MLPKRYRAMGDQRALQQAVVKILSLIKHQLVSFDALRRGDEVVGAGWRLVSIADHTQDATTARWFADREIRWVLQRPDFHAYGSASTDAEARTVFWFANGRFVGRSQPEQAFMWTPDPGQTDLKAMDEFGRISSRRLAVETVP